MNDATVHLALATAFFLASHIGISSTPLRGALVRALGEKPYLGLYSLVATGGLVWMAVAYAGAPVQYLWSPSGVLRYVPLVVMPFALILLVAGLTIGNPTLVSQEGALRREEPARGILRVTRHPVQWALALWAAAHLLANGDVASLLFFGGLLLLALAGPYLMDARKAATLGEEWAAFAARTSTLPFAAIVAGRNRLDLGEIGWWRVGLALVAYAGLLVVHSYLFGVAPY